MASFLIKANETVMHDKLGYYPNTANGVVAYLQDMGISMRNSAGSTVTTYSTDNYIELADVVSTYCAPSSNAYSSHSVFKDQYKYSSGSSLFDCFMSDDGEDPATAYIEVKGFKITKNSTTSTFKLALRGTRPHFTKGYTLAAGSLLLKSDGIYNGTTKLSDFTTLDGDKRPLRYICLLQGGGGGGSGTYGDHSGSGAGGGGFLAAYVHINTTAAEIKIGSAGARGYKGGGSAGGDTTLIRGSTLSLTASGGKGGRYGSGSQGAGGSTAVTYGTSIVNGKTIAAVAGGAGGVGDYAGGSRDGKNGTDISKLTMTCTATRSTNDTNYSKELSAKSGGKHQSNYGGGGGASQMGGGGGGGTPAQGTGKAAGGAASGKGGGGGGGTYIFLAYVYGGNGSAGTFEIYY